MYRGGFVVAGLLAALVVASVARPDAGPLGRLLSPRPLRWVGRLSERVYRALLLISGVLLLAYGAGLAARGLAQQPPAETAP